MRGSGIVSNRLDFLRIFGYFEEPQLWVGKMYFEHNFYL